MSKGSSMPFGLPKVIPAIIGAGIKIENILKYQIRRSGSKKNATFASARPYEGATECNLDSSSSLADPAGALNTLP